LLFGGAADSLSACFGLGRRGWNLVWGGSATDGSKKEAFLHGRLATHGGKGLSVRQLGGGRAGEMRIIRFLHNPKVTVSEMVATSCG
jgi:hypothetical protein